MGTTLRIAVSAATREAGTRAIEDAFMAVRRADSLLSTWREDSEIARINTAPVGRPFRLSPQLWSLLKEANHWFEQTGGAFDPGIGPLVDVWDLRGQGRLPSSVALARARSASGWHRFSLSRSAPAIIRTHEASWIDTGGFGKGVALREARAALLRAGSTSAVLNFGGQVLVFGADRRGMDWTIPVAHPSRRAEPAAWLELRTGSVSTSSQSERFVTAGGERIGHILDPRTGRPVPAWGSVTVIAEDPTAADVISTALLVLGPDRGLDWARERRDVAVLFLIERQGRLERRWNAELEHFLVSDSTVHGRT
jgi:FAD:protein FMN transferase